MSQRELRPLDRSNLDEVLKLWEVSFGQRGWFGYDEAPVSQGAALERGEIFGWLDGNEILGTASLTVQDHWFGGRRVPSQHVGGVGIPPENRGRGEVRDAMTAVMRHGAENGALVSVLFATTTRLYRSLGWEHSGRYNTYRLDARQVPRIGEHMRPLGDDEGWEAVRSCHEEFGRLCGGAAFRSDLQWEPIQNSKFAYVLDSDDGGVDAYIVYNPSHASGEYWYYDVEVADWAARNARGMEAVVGFIGSHGTMGKTATFKGPDPHLFTFLIPEQDLQFLGGAFWLVRVLDLPGAIEARGFPDGIEVDCSFEFADPHLEQNSGSWNLQVKEGEGALTRVDTASMTLDLRGFGPLYTGFVTPQQLQLSGLLRGSPADLQQLATAFAGPSPVVFDHF